MEIAPGALKNNRIQVKFKNLNLKKRSAKVERKKYCGLQNMLADGAADRRNFDLSKITFYR
jgi:hypothetical protein